MDIESSGFYFFFCEFLQIIRVQACRVVFGVFNGFVLTN